jgi:selenide, water dikinase
VDFFTPIVDDPYAFGLIAAANALSDVYSMGAKPITALNIIAFPDGDEPGMDVLSEILRGGYDKCEEAGVVILGGHSVDDKEPKYGLAVTGTVHPDRFWTIKGAQPGDKLVLTKPLGTGILSTAIKGGKANPEQIELLIQTASALNKSAAEAAASFDIHAATDVTGFGTANHLLDLCKASDVGAEVSISALPLLSGVRELVEAKVLPGGTKRNLQHARPDLDLGPEVTETDALIFADAQTSGGLLFAVPEEQAESLRKALIDCGTLAAAIIGQITPSEAGKIRLVK